MKRWLLMMVIGTCGTMLLSAHAQQPAGKGPMPPPVNPATAKLDITITGLGGPCFGIATGNDGNLLVVASEDGTLQAFKKDALLGKPDLWKGGHLGPVRGVAWTSGTTVASVGADKKINFWKDGKPGASGTSDVRVLAMVMSSDGKTLATAGESETIQLWDVAAGKPTGKLSDKMDWTLALAFSADGKQILSGDYLGVVRLWDVAGTKKVNNLPAPPMPAPKTPLDPVPVTCVAFGPDGKTGVLGTAEGAIQLFNLGDGKVVRTFPGHTGPITGIVFHPTGTLMATCSKDRTVKLWNPAAPQPAVQALKSLDGHSAWIEGIVFIEQGTKLATVSADQTIRIWDLAEAAKKK